MLEPLFPLATFSRKGAVTEGRFDLMLDNHIEEVWDALTKPDVRVQWLAPGTIEPGWAAPPSSRSRTAASSSTAW